MREEVGEEVLGDDTDIALDVVVEDKLSRDGRLILPAPSSAFLGQHSHRP